MHYSPRETGGVRVFYVLEFFLEHGSGEKLRLQTLGHEATSEARAIEYAQAFLRNVTIEDRRPNLCLVKSVGGKVLNILASPSLTMGDGPPDKSPATQAARQE
jgi:hypothetical protein